MNLVLPMPSAPSKPRRDSLLDRIRMASTPAGASAGVRSGLIPGGGRQRRVAALAIVALHGLLLWGLAHYGVARDLTGFAPPLLVQVLAPAPEERPQPPATLPAPPKVRLPDPPPWVPPPEVQTIARREPAISLQSVVPPATPAAVAPVEAAPVAVAPSPAPLASAPALPRQPAAQPALLATSALRFLRPPVAEYPRASRRNRESGVVLVRAWVAAGGGAPPEVRVERSSGFVRLDEEAVRAVQRASFAPTVQEGRVVEGWAVFPVTFALEP